MLISQHLKLEAISVNLNCDSIEHVIFKLANLVSKTSDKLDEKKLGEDLLRRERLLSTAVGCGIALPHCTSTKIKFPEFAIGISSEGIDVESPDNKPVHIFFAVVSPEKNPGSHLDALSAASKIFIHADVREAVHTAKTPEEVLKAIANAEKKKNG